MLEHFGPEWSDEDVWPFDGRRVELLGIVADYEVGAYFVYEWNSDWGDWKIRKRFDRYEDLMTFVRQELRAERDALEARVARLNEYLLNKEVA